METSLTIASKRDERAYADRALPPEIVDRILDAGRLTGSARNRQPWRFFVATDAGARERLSAAVYVPRTVAAAALVVTIAVRAAGSGLAAFDAGRAAQNMMLAAWGEGVASCPNGVSDMDAARSVLGVDDDEAVVSVISFGEPARARDPERRTALEWSARANRLALADLVVPVTG